jgi:hypothetical protein
VLAGDAPEIRQQLAFGAHADALDDVQEQLDQAVGDLAGAQGAERGHSAPARWRYCASTAGPTSRKRSGWRSSPAPPGHRRRRLRPSPSARGAVWSVPGAGRSAPLPEEQDLARLVLLAASEDMSALRG